MQIASIAAAPFALRASMPVIAASPLGSDAPTQTGTVAYFNAAQGFGLIRSEASPRPDVFVHVSELVAPATHLQVGDRVEFVRVEASAGQKLPHATAVTIVTGG